MSKIGKIFSINGPIVKADNEAGFVMHEMVHVGPARLVGEVIILEGKVCTIQVYEETTGLKPGEEVEGFGAPISVTLAPGILNNIFDGIERPLKSIELSRLKKVSI